MRDAWDRDDEALTAAAERLAEGVVEGREFPAQDVVPIVRAGVRYRALAMSLAEERVKIGLDAMAVTPDPARRDDSA